MTLRTIVLALAFLGAATGLLLVANAGTAWPLLLPLGIVVAGIVFERYDYRGNATDAAPGQWRETDERFLDTASGRTVIVWYNATTGERRYVDE